MATIKLTWFKEVAFNLPVPGFPYRTDIETTPHTPTDKIGLGVEVYAVDAAVEVLYTNDAYFTVPAGALRSFPVAGLKEIRDQT